MTTTIQPSDWPLLGDLQLLVGRVTDAERSYGLVRDAYRDAEQSGEVTDLEVAVFEADHAEGPVTAALAVERARLAFEARPDSIHVADAMAWTLVRAGALLRRDHSSTGPCDSEPRTRCSITTQPWCSKRTGRSRRRVLN